MKKKLISLVIPVKNERQNVSLIYAALKLVWNELVAYDYEFIFINDGATDGSGEEIEKIAAADKNVKYIEFSRNFGKEMATTAGIHAAKGDAIIMIDADLQHPPELIPIFVAEWAKGAEVVVGLRTSNDDAGLFSRLSSKLFYAIMRAISETEIAPGETDFRLIDVAVADAFRSLPEHNRMTRSLINWLGFKKVTIEFVAPSRQNGIAQYKKGKLFHLALSSFMANSLTPLRMAGYLGVCITLASAVLGILVFTERYVLHDAFNWHVSGSAQLAIINVFLIGIVLMSLGIIALYIGTIHTEVAGRPLYVVRRRTNFEALSPIKEVTKSVQEEML